MAPNTALAVLIILLLVTFATLMVTITQGHGEVMSRVRRVIITLSSSCFVVCVIGAFIVKSLSASSQDNDGELIVARDKAGRVVEVSDSSVWTIGRTVSFVTTWAVAASSVQPITDNPKVRRLHYEAMVQVTDPVVFMQTCGPMPGQVDTAAGNLQRLKDTLGYQLFEFNNARSKDLAKFYNPLSTEQTKELESMLRNHLDEALKPKGVAFVRLQAWSVE